MAGRRSPARLEPGALVLTAGRLCLLHAPRPPSPAPRDAVWSPDAPPGGAHGPPGLPVHGQPRRATRPGPRGHGARPQASSAPARPEPGPEPGPAGAHRPRAEPQVSGGGGGGCPARRGRTQDPQGRGGKPGRRGVSREQASRVGCLPRRWAEGALDRFLCVPTPWREAVTVAPFLSPTLSLSAPQCSGSRGMEAGLWHQGSGPSFRLFPSAVVQCAFLRSPSGLTP